MIVEILFMGNFLVSLPPKWEDFLEGLADDHDIDVGKVISGLCEWAFSSADYKVQFEVWLDKAYPPKGQSEDRAKDRGEAASEREEARQDNEEEEVHEDRDYSEDRAEMKEHEWERNRREKWARNNLSDTAPKKAAAKVHV